MECFVVNGIQPLTIITKHSILDVVAALDPPLIYDPLSVSAKFCQFSFAITVLCFFYLEVFFFCVHQMDLSYAFDLQTFLYVYMTLLFELLLLLLPWISSILLLFQYCIVLALLLILSLSLLIVNHCLIEFQAWTSQKQIYWDYTGCSPVTLL